MFTAGLFLFLFILLMAFWMLIFLTAVALPYALTVYVINKLKPASADEGQDETAAEASV